MIRLHVSAVCRIRDGYTGEPVEAASLLCTLDGLPVRPLAKPGGYLVLLDLTAGEHRLALRGHGYQEEWVDIRVGAGTQELEVTMKPGPGYPFRGAVTRMELTVTRDQLPLSRQQLWLAVPAQYELKVAQTKAAAGEEQFRIYCKGPQVAVQPGAYLIVDGTDSEIVSLRELAGDRRTAHRGAPGRLHPGGVRGAERGRDQPDAGAGGEQARDPMVRARRRRPGGA